MIADEEARPWGNDYNHHACGSGHVGRSRRRSAPAPAAIWHPDPALRRRPHPLREFLSNQLIDEDFRTVSLQLLGESTTAGATDPRPTAM